MLSFTSSSLYSGKSFYQEDHEILDLSIDDSRKSCPDLDDRVKNETTLDNRRSAPSRLPLQTQR